MHSIYKNGIEILSYVDAKKLASFLNEKLHSFKCKDIKILKNKRVHLYTNAKKMIVKQL